MAFVELTKDNLESTIGDNEIVLIDFWANWCGPCKVFKPVFEKASEQHPEVTFASCDTEQATDVAASFGVRSIPTLAVFRDQVLLYLEAGALPENILEELIQKVKSLDMDEVREKIAEAEAEEKNKEKSEEKSEPS